MLVRRTRIVRTLYVEPAGETNAGKETLNKEMFAKIATRPSSLWLGPEWTPDPKWTVDSAVSAAGTKLRTLVVYGIPFRDGSAYSAGGCLDAATYATFIAAIAAGLNKRRAIVVLEPDAICLTDHLSSVQLTERLSMLTSAVDALSAAGAHVYIDAGDSDWIPAMTVATRLLEAGVRKAKGFALNVSHTEYEHDEHVFAGEIREVIGAPSHYIVDTSRCGLGPGDATGEARWCNPTGRALGRYPTGSTGEDGCDWILWVKPPGESDGECNGGPPAGTWWPEYALGLAERA